MCFQEGLHLADPACAKGRRAVPEVWSFAAGRLRTDRTGWRCRFSEQEACGLVGLSGLQRAPAAVARETVCPAMGFSLRRAGQAEPAPGPLPAAQITGPGRPG